MFHWSQFLVWIASYLLPPHVTSFRQGVLICCAGMGLLVYSDQSQNQPDGPGQSVLAGDLFMLAGATLYGFSEDLCCVYHPNS
jgi:solute carrier family 35 protein F1/2